MENTGEAASPAIEGRDSLRAQVENTNIAEDLDDEELELIGSNAFSGFDYDLQSRSHWEQCLESWTKLSLQGKEENSWPWVKASNVKYPLLSIASMQFNARAYPSLIPATSSVVKMEVIGKDPTGEKLAKANRLSEFMSYQVLNKMDGWEEDMDKLLIMLPIVGTVFKKTYYDSTTKQNVSALVLPKNLVVNYWAQSLECAERISEVLYMTKRQVKEKMMSGIYRDILDELGEPSIDAELLRERNDDDNVAHKLDETTPYTIIEQHCYLDLDEDDYAEPYIVTFEKSSQKVLRIVARYDEKGIIPNAKGKLAKIEPIHYFTKFSFIPNPDGGFYDIGFGRLLGPLNESVNTLINQLIDSGTIHNLQSGFLGKGLKLKMGQTGFQPGEWKTVQTTADDLKKQIVPLPSKEPSTVLFQLMQALINGAKELASVAEIFTGKMPGQNTPATTTMATVEQGMKVFTAVYKRVFRSLKSEFKKIFDLNATYLDMNFYQSVVDEPIDASDFDSTVYDVCPGADPNTSTQSEKLMKAQGLMEMLQLGTLDPIEVTRRMLDAMEQPNPEKLFSQAIQQTGQMPPPQPDPKVLALQEKTKADQQRIALETEKTQREMEMKQRDAQVQLAMKAQESKIKQASMMQEAQAKAAAQQAMDQARVHGAVQKTAQDAQSHQQSMMHQEEQHKLALKQSQQKSSETGRNTPSRKPSSKASKPSGKR